MRIAEVRIELTERNHFHGVFRPTGLGENENEACEVHITLCCSPGEARAIYNMQGRPVDVRSAQEDTPQLPENATPEVMECRVDDARALPPKSTIP